MMKEKKYNGNEIAIIGMSGRFPGAKNVQEYWQILKEGKSPIRILTGDQLLALGVESEVINQPDYVKASSMLEGIDLFDASFFGYTPREAELMDPQQRIFLECAWEALESAGYTPSKTDELISVFASSSFNTYLLCNLLSNRDLLTRLDPVQIDLSNGNDSLATRVSYKLNLKGASCAVQTACSSSLVAVHLACQNLLNAESDIALAGGISIDPRQRTGYRYFEGGIASPDGRCRAFDAAANGTIFGSGAGVVVLRRLEDALANGDAVFAVIKGSAVNNDGADKVGFTAPGVDGQAAVIAEALAVADCDPATISYVETHGTGTRMGDPIEIRALCKAYQKTPLLKKNCAIGSVKSQIGHLAGAAGISSLIKTILAIHHRQIPPSLNFHTPNPDINFKDSPFYVNTVLKDWQHEFLRAGVSSFGFGGTNVHLILEEAPGVLLDKPGVLLDTPGGFPADSMRDYHLIPLSARTEAGLSSICHNLAQALEEDNGLDLADIAFTLQVGRKDFPYRRFIVCRNTGEAVDRLQSSGTGENKFMYVETEDRPVVFLFPGNKGMGHSGLYENEKIFKFEYDKCLDALNAILDRDNHNRVTERMMAVPGQPPVLKRIDHFITGYALAALLREADIIPEFMIGEDAGEYTAACFSGILPMEQVFLILLRQAELKGEPGLDGYNHRRPVESFPFKAPAIPVFSGFSGTWPGDSMVQSPDYWLKERKANLSYTAALSRLTDNCNEKVLLNLGRAGYVPDMVKDSPAGSFIYKGIGEYSGDPKDQESLMTCLGVLWSCGVKINWRGLYRNEARHRIPLPAYPFNRQRYWIEENKIPALSHNEFPAGKDPDHWFYYPGWKSFPLTGKPAGLNKKEWWLIFCDPAGFSSGIINYLSERNQPHIQVCQGETYQQVSDTGFCIDPGNKADYYTLFNTLKVMDRIPAVILHFWSIDSDSKKDAEANFFYACQKMGFWSIINTVLAMKEVSLRAAFKIWIISSHLFQVESSDTILPEKATLLSPVWVIPYEYPEIDCRCLDISYSGHESSDPWLAGQVMNQIQTPGRDKVIAIRGSRRWVRSFESLELTKQAEQLSPGRIYLVLDDASGICLFLAEFLIKELQATVILVENTLFPGRELWEEGQLTEGKLIVKIQKIRALEESRRLELIRADFLQMEEVEQIIGQIVKRHGALHGVIHGADDTGRTGFNSLQEAGRMKPDDFPGLKIKSVYNLQKALGTTKLDFFIFISSLASVLGGPGQVINAAQSLFLDSYALHTGGVSLSMNWDIWHLPDIENPFHLRDEILKSSISPEDGVRVFHKILAGYTGNQIIISTMDIMQRMEHLAGERSGMAANNQTRGQALPAKHPRPGLRYPYVAPGNKTEEILAKVWEDCLGIEKIGIDDNFFDLGGDSLLSINVMNQLSTLFEDKQPAAILYQKSTIRELAQLFGEEKDSAIQEKSGKLSRRKEELRRRNLLLHKMHQEKKTGGVKDYE